LNKIIATCRKNVNEKQTPAEEPADAGQRKSVHAFISVPPEGGHVRIFAAVPPDGQLH